jgi:hypothetical protein
MSLLAHGPLGLASGVALGEATARVVALCVGATAVVVVVGAADATAPTRRAAGAEVPPPPPLPRRWAMPNTSPSATTRTSSRRVQYTRGGNGPRGRVTVLTRAR